MSSEVIRDVTIRVSLKTQESRAARDLAEQTKRYADQFDRVLRIAGGLDRTLQQLGKTQRDVNGAAVNQIDAMIDRENRLKSAIERRQAAEGRTQARLKLREIRGSELGAAADRAEAERSEGVERRTAARIRLLHIAESERTAVERDRVHQAEMRRRETLERQTASRIRLHHIREAEMTAAATRRLASDLANTPPPLPGRSSRAPTFGQSLERISSGISKVAVPLTVIAAGPLIIRATGEALKGVAADLIGGDAANREGVFTRAWNDFTEGASDFGNALNARLSGLLGIDLPHGPERERVTARAGGEIRRPARLFTEENRELKLLGEQLDLTRERARIQREMDREALSALDRQRAELQRIVEVQNSRLDMAREEFGLLTGEEKRNALIISARIRDEGIGALTPGQLEFARRNRGVFGGGLEEKAAEFADASGFQRIVRNMDLNRPSARQLELEQQITLNQKVEVTVNGLENMAEALEAAILPKLLQEIHRQQDRVQKDIDHLRVNGAF